MLKMLRKSFFILLGVVFILLIAEFTTKNGAPVELHFFSFHKTDIPFYIVIFFSFGIGALTILFIGVMEFLRAERSLRVLRKKNLILKKELESIKKIPLNDNQE